MFKPILASILSVSALCAPVSAMTEQERGDHVKIVEALEQANVTVHVNEEKICGDGERFLGAYIPGIKAVVICQEHATAWDGEAIAFSLEDLDTLRHEAHHVLQDCLDGDLDGNLDLLFADADEKAEFYGWISPNLEPKVRRIYGLAGASEHVIQLEIEAFGVAAEVPAATIAKGVRNICKYVM